MDLKLQRPGFFPPVTTSTITIIPRPILELVQLRHNLPLRRRLLPNRIPQFPETVGVVVISRAVLVVPTRINPRLRGSDLGPEDHGVPFCRRQTHHPRSRPDLLLPVPEVQEVLRVYDVDLAVQFAQLFAAFRSVVFFEYVPLQEVRLERSPVPEKVVSQVEVFEAEVGAVEILAGGAVGDETADFLTETAAEVEEGLGRGG